jgi:hypothetical protein
MNPTIAYPLLFLFMFKGHEILILEATIMKYLYVATLCVYVWRKVETKKCFSLITIYPQQKVTKNRKKKTKSNVEMPN